MPRSIRLILLCGLLGGCAVASPPPDAPRAVVFFQTWSAAIDRPAAQAISNIAGNAQASPTDHLWVIGYAELTGSERANKLLSATRAQMVTDQLVADGVAPDRIQQVAHGRTGSEQSLQESRRVVVVTAP